jgi:hypothetical protein
MNNLEKKIRPLVFVCVFLGTLLTVSCTENSRSRFWGGEEEFVLPPHEEILNVTWKETDMWICTRDTVTGNVYFREKSNWGVLEGTITFKQAK